MTEEEVNAAAEAGAEASVDEDMDGATEIRDTDIVFDCPHCGHNLAIDYRGAGLQIDCVNCGESVLVPIPSGMQIEDLDLDPGEILKQLFATRRNLQKAEQRAADLEDQLREMSMKRDALQAMLESVLVGVNTLRDISGEQSAVLTRLNVVLDRLTSDITLETAAEADSLSENGVDVVVDEGGSTVE